MKIIEIDEELYQYIASQTQSIGESASDILRRLLDFSSSNNKKAMEYADKYSFTSQNQLDFEEPVDQVTSTGPERKVIEEITVPIITTKKQPIEAINHIADKVRQVLVSENFLQESKAVVRFLEILRVLYRTNPESFSIATESMQGRTRLYFARDEGSLLVSGNHTKPKQIPDTPYWVITNTNSARKMLMLENAMQSMQLPQELIDEVRPFFIAN